MSEKQQIQLTLDYPKTRLDQALTLALPDYSRAQCQELIRNGHVVMNGMPIHKTSFRLRGGEKVIIDLPEVVDVGIIAEDIPLDVLYEDEDIIMVIKPAGMVTHPSLGHERGTLVNAVLGYCPDLAGVGSEKRPGIVHRLDKHTSGIIAVAKNDRALRHLQAQFKQRTVKKVYWALVDGLLQPPQALIDAPIGRLPQERKRMGVITDKRYRARDSQTTYQVLTYYDEHTLVECHPHTGRTHQIRVHLAYTGYPVMGDVIYGRRRKSIKWLKRHFLHAAGLTIKRPSDNKSITIWADLTPELQAVLNHLQQTSQDIVKLHPSSREQQESAPPTSQEHV